MALFLFFVVGRIIVESDEMEEAGDCAEKSGIEAGDAGGSGKDAGDGDGSGITDESDSSTVIEMSKKQLREESI